jgi:hypothetical protein
LGGISAPRAITTYYHQAHQCQGRFAAHGSQRGQTYAAPERCQILSGLPSGFAQGKISLPASVFLPGAQPRGALGLAGPQTTEPAPPPPPLLTTSTQRTPGHMLPLVAGLGAVEVGALESGQHVDLHPRASLEVPAEFVRRGTRTHTTRESGGSSALVLPMSCGRPVLTHVSRPLVLWPT